MSPMLAEGIPYVQILVAVAFAVFFYRAAEMEDAATPWIWGAVSGTVSALTICWLHWGWLGIITAQGGVFIGITIVKLQREK